MMPKHAFELLVLAVELFVQISNVNSIDAKWSMLMMAVNTCCGVAPAECRAKQSLYNRVMKSTIVLLNVDVSPAVKLGCAFWTFFRSRLASFSGICRGFSQIPYVGIKSYRARLICGGKDK